LDETKAMSGANNLLDHNISINKVKAHAMKRAVTYAIPHLGMLESQ
jgi:hypothetical protein